MTNINFIDLVKTRSERCRQSLWAWTNAL